MHGHEGSPTRNVLKQETVLQAYRARPWNNCENIDKKNLSQIFPWFFARLRVPEA